MSSRVACGCGATFCWGIGKVHVVRVSRTGYAGRQSRCRDCSPAYLPHLSALTRNRVRLAGILAAVPVLAGPASTQREAFGLIGVPVRLIVK